MAAPTQGGCVRRFVHAAAAPALVLALAAAEEGIFAGYHALLAPGDHAVVEAPCYGSAMEVARSTGASVDVWLRRYEDAWAHDTEDLEIGRASCRERV